MTKKDLKLLIGKNKTKEVIQTLLSMTEVVDDNDELFNRVILLSSRYESCIADKQNGIIDYDVASSQINIINGAILTIIHDLPDSIERVEKRNSPITENGKFVELLLDQYFFEYNSSLKENLVNTVADLLKIQRREVVVRRVANGSVKIILEMSEEASIKLKQIYYSLSGFEILRIDFKVFSIKNISVLENELLDSEANKKISVLNDKSNNISALRALRRSRYFASKLLKLQSDMNIENNKITRMKQNLKLLVKSKNAIQIDNSNFDISKPNNSINKLTKRIYDSEEKIKNLKAESQKMERYIRYYNRIAARYTDKKSIKKEDGKEE